MGLNAEVPTYEGGRSNMNAPAFYDVANKPGLTVIALSVWFMTPHSTMPNFVFTEDETSNLSAYILSLRKLNDRLRRGNSG